jgi:hypothetical protein
MGKSPASAAGSEKQTISKRQRKDSSSVGSQEEGSEKAVRGARKLGMGKMMVRA